MKFIPILSTKKNESIHTHTEMHIQFFPSLTHFLPRLACTLFPTGTPAYFGTLIYSAVTVVFGHFLFSSRTLVYSIHLYLPASDGSIRTSGCRPLQSKQRRTSHCEGRKTNVGTDICHYYYCTNDNYAGHFNPFFSSIALALLFSWFLGFICLGSSGKENTFLRLQ